MENFVNRLEFLLEHFELSASAFADKIGVQRSSLSHILSGRNKASLDFILKINDTFPELNLEWLIKGIGSFSGEKKQEIFTSKSVDLFSNGSQVEPQNPLLTPAVSEAKKEVISPKPIPDFFTSTDIEQIVVFYKDGTFITYKPR
ncbi:helix-turn-helix transcriptional regulator [Myroides sp. 1354]|uniref:helix-turn-helix domain-containing protein n=1 Tax=unclassified Myroides TaxID=2642485 RepID=UPI0025779A63|nr:MULTISPECIES: helix-turn-helix transcriptional regulator [unclassified Myroides]MDM1045997.1 helix-turn-helix transcriptional regulator [Myroides sp. R163-1]MDM1055847.1 helix-turn-helix transcriptional regulator [Myroides sp. 1354]MDM1070028.1 helix-turn-helix transcriptional regulator [Myroides sp. 1372]